MFAEKGICNQRSVAGIPQQNGRVERKHIHLIETARTIKIHAGIPNYLWGECVLAATHVINLMPSSVLNWKTPYERLTKKVPNYDHLRVVGCLYYAFNTHRHGDKFAEKGTRCILLGYPGEQKTYKLFKLEKKKIIVSRDVVFKKKILLRKIQYMLKRIMKI